MVRIDLFITEEQHKFLKDIKGMTISSWIRFMISEGIHKANQEKFSASQSPRSPRVGDIILSMKPGKEKWQKYIEKKGER